VARRNFPSLTQPELEVKLRELDLRILDNIAAVSSDGHSIQRSAITSDEILRDKVYADLTILDATAYPSRTGIRAYRPDFSYMGNQT
jgi:hypothetical protein